MSNDTYKLVITNETLGETVKSISGDPEDVATIGRKVLNKIAPGSRPGRKVAAQDGAADAEPAASPFE